MEEVQREREVWKRTCEGRELGQEMIVRSCSISSGTGGVGTLKVRKPVPSPQLQVPSPKEREVHVLEFFGTYGVWYILENNTEEIRISHLYLS